MELKTLLSAILNDLLEARRQADSYSKHISQEYRKDGPLAGFAVPRLNVNGVKLDLKFALDTETEKTDDVPSPSMTADTFHIKSVEALKEKKTADTPETATADMRAALSGRTFTRLSVGDTAKITGLTAKSLENDILGNNNLRGALNKDVKPDIAAAKINAAFANNVTLSPEGEVTGDSDKIAETVMADLNLNKSEKIRLSEEVKASVSAAIGRLKETAVAKTTVTPHVIVEASRLEKLPQHMISSLSLDLNIADKGWTDIEEYDLYKQRLADVS